MRRITKGSEKLFYLFIVGVLLVFSSCKTTRVATTSKAVVKPMSTAKLIRNIENNAFDYKYLSIKKINCQFDNGIMSASFKASLHAEKDEQITLMLSKLNIPMARLWLTPDSVKFINYLDDSYLLDDYSYLSDLMDMNLDFNVVNAIISNDVLSVGNQKHDADLNYESSVENGMYVLRTVRNNDTQDRKPFRRLKKGEKQSAVVQTMYIDPVTFKLNKLTLEDAPNARKVNIDFSDFTPVGKQLYPGEIQMSLVSPDSNMQMKIRLSNFSLEKEKGVRFKVPEKFTRKGHE
ncbi:MAG: DUF4292 domain-containing protein [Candidatus Saccharibacteria bacterium]